jgi:hypothetical protein
VDLYFCAPVPLYALRYRRNLFEVMRAEKFHLWAFCAESWGLYVPPQHLRSSIRLLKAGDGFLHFTCPLEVRGPHSLTFRHHPSSGLSRPVRDGVVTQNIIIFNILSRVCGDYIRRVLDWQLYLLDHTQLQCIHFITHNNWVYSLSLKTSAPTLQPLLQPTLMASLAITH